MIIRTIIIFTIAVVELAAVERGGFCRNGMDVIEQEEERRLNGEVLGQLRGIFQQEPRLISKIFQFVLNKDKQILLPLKQKIINKIQTYPFFIIIICSLCFTFHKSIPPLVALGKYIGRYIAHQRLHKIGRILIVILCLFVVLQSYRGIEQSQKHKKNVNYFLCRVLQQPSNIVKGESLEGINELQKYVEQALRNFMVNFMTLRPALIKLQATKQMIDTAQLILNNLSNSSQSNQYALRLAKVRSDLMTVYNYSIKRPRTLYDAYRIPNRILQASLLVNSLTKNINYIQSEFNLMKMVGLLAKAQSLFFCLVGILAVTVAIVLSPLNKENTDKKDKYLHLLLYAITSILITCLLIYFAVSVILPTLFWTSNATQFAFDNQDHFFQEFNLLNKFNPQLPQSISMIIPINRKVVKMYFGHFQNETKTVIEALQPYAHQQANYFFSLYIHSLDYVSSKQEEIKQAIDQHYVQREDFIKPITDAYRSLANILELYQEGGRIQKIDGNVMGRYITNLFDLFFQLAQNRLFALQQITKKLGVLLLIMLLVTVTAEQKKMDQNREDKCEQRGIDLSEIY